MTRAHAKLSPSSAHRWMNCPGSVALSVGVPSTSSAYADEGTRAHVIAELLLDHPEDFDERYETWLATVTDYEQREMTQHAEGYVTYVLALDGSEVLVEQTLQSGVPGCWGTSDAVVLDGSTLHVIDYKYGQGVRVDATENEQLRLYGCGALSLFPDVVTVVMHVYQPRLNHVSTETLTAVELLRWRDHEVKPVAELALSGNAYVSPSDSACRFCPIAGSCRARVEVMTKRDFSEPPTLSGEEIADVLDALPMIEAWCKDVREHATDLAVQQRVPGWKTVRTNGKRQITDESAAIHRLVASGLSVDDVSRTKLRTLADLDRLTSGALADVLGDLIQKTSGTRTLVPEDDPRPSEVQADFDVIG